MSQHLTTGLYNVASYPRVKGGPWQGLVVIPKKLLILDDNAPFAESLSDLLTQQGFQTRWATLAEEANRIAASFAPDVLIIDVNLATQYGLDVASQFWNDKRTSAFIFLTGKVEFDVSHVPEELKQRSIVLHKPVDKETLLDAIARVPAPAAAAKQR